MKMIVYISDHLVGNSLRDFILFEIKGSYFKHRKPSNETELHTFYPRNYSSFTSFSLPQRKKGVE